VYIVPLQLLVTLTPYAVYAIFSVISGGENLPHYWVAMNNVSYGFCVTERVRTGVLKYSNSETFALVLYFKIIANTSLSSVNMVTHQCQPKKFVLMTKF